MTSRQLVASFKTQFARVNGIQISTRNALSSSAASYSSPLLAGNVSAILSSAVAAGRGNNANSASLNFVRYATKKAAGSKTSNKDSAGRRLGSKKADGEEVHVGEIIYRQRGTKIYPGENVGIGKDHTLFALEKGWVRFYYDPFHPNRKFAGIVLTKEHRLPSPHFAPTARRFGRTELAEEDATKEFNYLPQKERRLLPQIQEAFQARQAQRDEKLTQFRTSLKEIAPQACASEAESEAAAQYLLAVKKFLSGGHSVEEAQKFAAREYKIDTTIDKNAGRITEEECASKISSFSALVEKVNGAVAFGPKLNLIKFQTEEEIKAERLDKVKQMEAIYKQGPVVKGRRDEIKKLIESDCFPMGYRFDLKKRFLKTIKPETEHQEYLKEKKFDKLSKSEMLALAKKKKGTVIRKWNYDLRKIEMVFVPKN